MPPATALSVHDASNAAAFTQRWGIAQLLRSGFPDLDTLHPVQPGQVTLLAGACDDVLYHYVASATRAGTVLVVDGGNRVDAYEIVNSGARLGMASDEALTRTFIARAFTPYQMSTLVGRVVPHWIENGPPVGALHRDELSLVVINDLSAQYLDQDTPRREGDVLHKRALRTITQCSRTNNGARVPILLATHSTGRDERARAYLEEETARADHVVVVEPPDKTGATRIRLPNRGVQLLARPEGALQRAIEDWIHTPTIPAKAR